MVKKIRWALGKGWDNTDKENTIRLEGKWKDDTGKVIQWALI